MPTTHARQESARRREEESVGRPKCRTANLTSQDGKFMAQHHNLEFLEFSRSKQKPDQLQDALKRNIANRNEHGTSRAKRAAILPKSS
jgi:hypothetical protein